MTTAAHSQVDNGVNVAALDEARQAIGANPDLAQFEWRATSNWIYGTHSQSAVESFYGLTDEQKHHTKFTFDLDHPEQFASQDKGITPIEYVLVALAGCLTGGIAAIAQHRQIQLRSVQATLTAEQNLQGILGLDPEVRNGFSGVRVSYQIDADATLEEIKALVAQSQKRSAVYDIITNPTNVTVDVA